MCNPDRVDYMRKLSQKYKTQSNVTPLPTDTRDHSSHYYKKHLDGLTFIEASANFIDWLEVIKNRSPKTVEQYSRHLEKFSEYLEEKNIDSFNFTI
jgi:hypothetical protein